MDVHGLTEGCTRRVWLFLDYQVFLLLNLQYGDIFSLSAPPVTNIEKDYLTIELRSRLHPYPSCESLPYLLRYQQL